MPAFPPMHLRAVKEDKGAEGVPFRKVVGSLMWIANQTRHDIANAGRWCDTLTTGRKFSERQLRRFSHVFEPPHAWGLNFMPNWM